MPHHPWYYNFLHYAGGRTNGGDDWTGYLDEVLEYDKESGVWKTIGIMTMKRTEHAVSVINYNSIKEYCT